MFTHPFNPLLDIGVSEKGFQSVVFLFEFFVRKEFMHLISAIAADINRLGAIFTARNEMILLFEFWRSGSFTYRTFNFRLHIEWVNLLIMSQIGHFQILAG